MNIELHTVRASALIPGVFCLAAGLPWQLSLPLQSQITACVAAIIAAYFTFSDSKNRVRQLCIEVHGGLTAIVGDSGECFKVRSVRVPRLLSFYAELVLQLDDGQAGRGRKVRLFVLPGACRADAFRCLRNYLLNNKKNGSHINHTAM